MSISSQDQTGQSQKTIQRVLVALDASPCSRAVLRSAGLIARAFDARLEGVFVEDINLLRAAELPVARELYYSGGVRPFSRSSLELEYRCFACEVEEWAQKVAESFTSLWEFHVRRGQIAHELLSAAPANALLSLGRYGLPICPVPRRNGVRLGGVARSVLQRRTSNLMLLHHEIQPGSTIYVLQEDPADSHLLATALRLAELNRSPIHALGVNADATAFALEYLAQNLEDRYVVAQQQRADSVAELTDLSASRGGTVLSARFLAGMESLECAVLVI